MSLAQTQSGYVKVIGRPSQPGDKLSHVVIQAKGMVNPVVSDTNGYFEIPFPDKKDGDPIVFLRIQKNDYELKDKGFIGRQFVYSPQVPIIIKMVDKKQLEADKKRIEDKAYHVAEENYQKMLKELEQKKKDAEITVDQYSQELVMLQDKYEKYCSLIGEMAERYARTDYDDLDSTDYQINLCIENGEFDKADSLIHTVFDPETVLERNQAAKNEIMERIKLAQSIIDRVNAEEEYILSDLEYAKRLAALCDNLADAYLLEGDKSKAIENLEKSLKIKAILYGSESEEVKAMDNKIKNLKS